MSPLSPELVEAATLEWLQALRTRSVGPGALAIYGDDLALVAMAGALVDADRVREGVHQHDGELTVERLVVEMADGGAAATVDLAATIVFPADDAPDVVAPSRISRELTVPLGSVYLEGVESELRLVDYTREALRMSQVWCTHPEGEDARGGLAAVPQAIRMDEHRGGRVYVEVSNALEREVVLRIGRPDRPRGLFKRQPPVEAPDVGLTVPAGGTTHFVGLTRRARLTELEIFAFDALDRSPVAALELQVELPRGHPGEHGEWCG